MSGISSDEVAVTGLLQEAWLDWYLKTFGDDESRVRDAWADALSLLFEEREKVEGTVEEFHNRSRFLPFVMAKQEAPNRRYYSQLRECLYLRPSRRCGVYVIGPTAGADVMAVSHAGGKPYLVGDNVEAPWQRVVEERLLSKGAWFESTSRADFLENRVNFRYVVISPWVANPVWAVRSAYNALGEHGFLFFPSDSTKLTAEAEAHGLRKLDAFQDPVSVYFKHPGAQDVCDED